MKNYGEYVKKLGRLFGEASRIPPGAPSAIGKPFGDSFAPDSETFRKTCAPRFLKTLPKALIFAPHPDDEAMSGGLALRLMRECGFGVKDVAVTLGSNRARRPGRRAELKECCKRLSWDLEICGGGEGFDSIVPSSRGTRAWKSAAGEIAEIISRENPAAVFAPHRNDWNKTHCGVSLLVADALETLGQSYCGMLFETEYWGAMKSPNLMVEIPPDILAAQIEATSCHIKEVERNPYHIRIPSWMSDNVRRGGELVGGQGGAVPDFDFAVLFRAKVRSARGWKSAFKSLFLPASENASTLFAKQPWK